MSRGMRIGKRVGGVRVSAGRGGVRVGSGKSYGHARVGVSINQRGHIGGGASYGTNAVRVSTNGHRIGVGVTGKTGPISYGAGVPIWHGVHAPVGMLWFANPAAKAGADLVPVVHYPPGPSEICRAAYAKWLSTPGWDERVAPYFRHPILVALILVGRFVTMIRDAATPKLPIL